MRVDANTFKTLYSICKNDSKFLITEEFISETRYPAIYQAICFFKNAPFFHLNHSERLMTAGFQGKEHYTVITCFRWNYKKLKLFLFTKLNEVQKETLGIPVQLMLPYNTDKIGTLKGNICFPKTMNILPDFEKEVSQVSDGKLNKTSALLYGLPGNGKTSYVKYLATKYSLPIMIFTLNPEWNNHDLLLLFSQIPNKCIVLLEDFDNYFNKRKSLFEDKVKFTYDIILNGLDGVFNSYQNVVFMMTVNDIEKVDDALKNRPSRFKYTKLFANPDLETRRELIQDWAERTENLNLDQIFRLSEYKNQGNSFVDAMNRLEKKVSIEEIAYFNWKDRIDSGLEGNSEDDWFDAEEMLKGYADDV